LIIIKSNLPPLLEGGSLFNGARGSDARKRCKETMQGNDAGKRCRETMQGNDAGGNFLKEASPQPLQELLKREIFKMIFLLL
jgi:hypothetical protein